MRALVPLYGDFTFWDQIISNPAGVGHVVANFGNGPPTKAAYIAKVRQAGVRRDGCVPFRTRVLGR